MKNKIRINHRGKQKQKRRTIIIIAASCLTCMVIGIIIFINTTQVDSSMADDRPSNGVAFYAVEDDIPTTEVTLPEPILKAMPVIGSNTQMIRSVKSPIQ